MQTKDYRVLHLSADSEAPALSYSGQDDEHVFIITSRDGHSWATKVTLSHQRSRSVFRNIVECRSVIVGCRLGVVAAQEFTYRVISASLAPGSWIYTECHQFSLQEAPDATCAVRAEDAISSLSRTLDSQAPEGVGNATKSKPQLRNSRRKKRKRGGAGEPNAVEGDGIEDSDARDQVIARAIIRKLSRAAQELIKQQAEPINPLEQVDISRELSRYRQLSGNTDDGTELENLLWNHQERVKKTAKEAVFDQLMLFSFSRKRRRFKGLPIQINPDVSRQATEKRWEEAATMYSVIVNRLYERRRALALVIFNLARKTNYILNNATNNVGQPRQVKIATIVADGLLFEPITINVASRVMHPAYFLAKNQRGEYAEICKECGLESLASLEVQPSDLERFEWEIPIQWLLDRDVEAEGRTWIIEKNGTRLVTDSVQADPLVFADCPAPKLGPRFKASNAVNRPAPLLLEQSKSATAEHPPGAPVIGSHLQAPNPASNTSLPEGRSHGLTSFSLMCASKDETINPQRLVRRDTSEHATPFTSDDSILETFGNGSHTRQSRSDAIFGEDSGESAPETPASRVNGSSGQTCTTPSSMEANVLRPDPRGTGEGPPDRRRNEGRVAGTEFRPGRLTPHGQVSELDPGNLTSTTTIASYECSQHGSGVSKGPTILRSTSIPGTEPYRLTGKDSEEHNTAQLDNRNAGASMVIDAAGGTDHVSQPDASYDTPHAVCDPVRSNSGQGAIFGDLDLNMDDYLEFSPSPAPETVLQSPVPAQSRLTRT